MHAPCINVLCSPADFLARFAAKSRQRRGNNRSVMPLDILGRTRATMACAESLFEVRPESTARLALYGATRAASACK